MAARLTLHQVTAHTPARAEPVAARLALQVLAADLAASLPQGLPPQALLWLRRLSLQAPEAALRRPAGLALREAWMAQGREQLDMALARARRPALGPVPPDTDAVLFADEAEMLACLAVAAGRGELARWWWRGLLGRQWPHWQAAWEARPQSRGAAQRLLARMGGGLAMGAGLASRPGEVCAGAVLPLAGHDGPTMSSVPGCAGGERIQGGEGASTRPACEAPPPAGAPIRQPGARPQPMPFIAPEPARAGVGLHAMPAVAPGRPVLRPADGAGDVAAPRPAHDWPGPLAPAASVPALASVAQPASRDAGAGATVAVALPAPDAPWPWPQAFRSRQAPLLFLVNALLEDRLYPDFTQPRDAGLPVPLWTLLGALAQVWRLPPDPLQALLAARATPVAPHEVLPAAPGVAVGPWEAWLPAYARSLRRRLCRRLAWPAHRWRAGLGAAPGSRLWVSESAWMVAFDLGGHDVAWRLAGLDRDPGWLPSVDCRLQFTFD